VCEAPKHHVDGHGEAVLHDRALQPRVRVAQEGEKAIDGTRPALDYEVRVEVAIGLQAVDEAQVPERVLPTLGKELRQWLHQCAEDFTHRRRISLVGQTVEEVATALHEGWHVALEECFDQRLLATEVVVKCRRGQASL
jgi:hypothetical protein